MKLLLDPGHGGIDSGAPGITREEKELNLIASLYLGGHLLYRGHEVHFTRTDDRTLSLAERVAKEQELLPDFFLSVHCNSASEDTARGFECFYFKSGKPLAEQIAQSVASSGIIPMRRPPVKRARFYVLRKTKAPAVLVELGFISNPLDDELLNQRERLLELLWSLSLGI